MVCKSEQWSVLGEAIQSRWYMCCLDSLRNAGARVGHGRGSSSFITRCALVILRRPGRHVLIRLTEGLEWWSESLEQSVTFSMHLCMACGAWQDSSRRWRRQRMKEGCGVRSRWGVQSIPGNSVGTGVVFVTALHMTTSWWLKIRLMALVFMTYSIPVVTVIWVAFSIRSWEVGYFIQVL